MSKRHLKKASALIKKWRDSWGSQERKFKHRQISKQIIKEELKDV